jgi:HSP20 family protein
MTRWDALELEWPERLRRWLDFDTEGEKLMRVEEMHEKDEVIVRAEMPGMDPDKDIDVWVDDGMLHISAKREQRSEHKDKGGFRSEFHYGEFARTLTLPMGVDKDAVKATYKDGILEVRIPCNCEPKIASKKVQVLRS